MRFVFLICDSEEPGSLLLPVNFSQRNSSFIPLACLVVRTVEIKRKISVYYRAELQNCWFIM